MRKAAPASVVLAEGAKQTTQLDYSTEPHSYLSPKGIDLASLKASTPGIIEILPTTIGWFSGNALFRELMDIAGNLQGFERILPERITFTPGGKPNDKFTVKGSITRGTFTPFGFHPSELMSMDCRVIVCNGLAEGYRIFEATGEPVASGIGDSAMQSVIEAIQTVNPRILVAVDNDSNGRKAGAASGYPWTCPTNAKDWSDVCQFEGVAAVRDQIHTNIKQPGADLSDEEQNGGAYSEAA